MPIHHLETGAKNMAGSSHLSTKSSNDRQFRISLPNKEDEDTDVQRGGPMLFSKSASMSTSDLPPRYLKPGNGDSVIKLENHSSLLLFLKYQVVYNGRLMLKGSYQHQ